MALLGALIAAPLDSGTAHFDASNLEIVSVDVGNPAFNVIPAEARAIHGRLRRLRRSCGAGWTPWGRNSLSNSSRFELPTLMLTELDTTENVLFRRLLSIGIPEILSVRSHVVNPANVLKKHHVHEPLDPRFRSAARLLQALWREERGLPIGSHLGEDGKRRKLGSRISQAAGRTGGNFLTAEIAHTARRETAYREIGAFFDTERLATNLLSSMPLTFNLLALWGHSLERASGYLIELLPAFSGAARQLLFEHSPGRGNPKYTGDNTAFDAMIRYSDGQGRNGFVAFEIKFSENMREPMPELKPRHAELSDASGLFTDPAAAALRTNPLAQLWRESLLAQSMIDNGLYAEGISRRDRAGPQLPCPRRRRGLPRTVARAGGRQGPLRQFRAGRRHRDDPAQRPGARGSAETVGRTGPQRRTDRRTGLRRNLSNATCRPTKCGATGRSRSSRSCGP
jgi:hypothetical protein